MFSLHRDIQQVLHDKEELISQFHVLLKMCCWVTVICQVLNILLGNSYMSSLIKWLV